VPAAEAPTAKQLDKANRTLAVAAEAAAQYNLKYKATIDEGRLPEDLSQVWSTITTGLDGVRARRSAMRRFPQSNHIMLLVGSCAQSGRV
jgi:hypothetical protein